MYISETTIRVRYAETDKMGFVYYGNYGQYFEIGRVEALRELEVAYKNMEELGVMMPVLAMDIQYIKPAFYDDFLTIKTTIFEMPQSRMEFNYEIYNNKEVLLTKGKTVHAFMDANTHKPVRVPEWIKTKLESFF